MKKIKIITGIVILSVITGFALMSCDLEDEYTWKFDNQSSYVVTITNTNFDPYEFTLPVNSTRTFTLSNTTVSFDYSPANYVNGTSNSTSKGGTFTFRNK
jgi:hypothetical protein